MNPLRTQLIPAHARGVPETVAEFEKELVKAVEAIERGAAALRQAEQAAKDAASVDAQAAVKAVRDGKSPAKATEPSKREALELARRTFQALRHEADQALAERDRAVRHADGWVEAQADVVDEALVELLEHADQLQAAHARLLEQAGVQDAIDARRSGGRLGPNVATWDSRRIQLRRGVETRPDGSRRQLSKPVEPTPDKLIEALRACAREVVPEPPEEPSAEELRKAADFQETRRAWQQLAKGGVYAGREGVNR